VLGDALLGAAVVACDAGGGVHCLVPAAGPDAQLLGRQDSLGAAAPPAASLDSSGLVRQFVLRHTSTANTCCSSLLHLSDHRDFENTL
jgi:hypothetical protein